jgi:hypothetical protein
MYQFRLNVSDTLTHRLILFSSSAKLEKVFNFSFSFSFSFSFLWKRFSKLLPLQIYVFASGSSPFLSTKTSRKTIRSFFEDVQLVSF